MSRVTRTVLKQFGDCSRTVSKQFANSRDRMIFIDRHGHNAYAHGTMAFVKLDCGMLRSTLWTDRECREVFITALLMAEPTELRTPTSELMTRELKDTGWIVPPGWYGFVSAASVGIIHAARIDFQEGLDALARLAAPGAESRSADFEGRRMVRVDGGFVILNWAKYRDRDHTSAARQQRWRDRKRNAVTLGRNTVTSRQVTQAEADLTRTPSGPAGFVADLTNSSSSPSSDLTEPSKPLDLKVVSKSKKRAPTSAPRAPSLFDRTLAEFCDVWAGRYGEKYQPTGADRRNLGLVLKDLPPEIIAALPKAFAAYLASHDPWIAQNRRHSLSYFCTSGGVNTYRVEAPAFSAKEARGITAAQQWLAANERGAGK